MTSSIKNSQIAKSRKGLTYQERRTAERAVVDAIERKFSGQYVSAEGFYIVAMLLGTAVFFAYIAALGLAADEQGRQVLFISVILANILVAALLTCLYLAWARSLNYWVRWHLRRRRIRGTGAVWYSHETVFSRPASYLLICVGGALGLSTLYEFDLPSLADLIDAYERARWPVRQAVDFDPWTFFVAPVMGAVLAWGTSAIVFGTAELAMRVLFIRRFRAGGLEPVPAPESTLESTPECTPESLRDQASKNAPWKVQWNGGRKAPAPPPAEPPTREANKEPNPEPKSGYEAAVAASRARWLKK